MANYKPKGKSKKFREDEDRDQTYKGKRSKGRSNSSRDNSRSHTSSDDEFLNGRAHSNDPSWWNRAGQISKDSASFAFQGANGAQLRGFELGRDYFTAPGIMVLDYVPTLGTISSSTHPVNLAARILYDRVNSKNSRTPSYDPSDLMVYIIALANAWAVHGWVRRVVGTYNTFDPQNRYWPRSIRSAMGCAPDTSDTLIVAWRQVANWMATRLNIFNVPKDIPYFMREIFMNNAVYMDMMSSKASYFMFNPRAFFTLVDKDEEDPSRVGGLKYAEFPSNVSGGITPDIIWKYFEQLVQPLFNDSIIPVMSADIEKSYGIENCFRLPSIDDTEMTIPVYNPEVLMQINNARFYPYQELGSLISQYAVRQNMATNTLMCGLLVRSKGSTMSNFYAQHPQLALPINFPVDNPGVDATIEATRLMWAVDPDSKHEGNYTNAIGTASTELLVDSYIVTFDVDDHDNWVEHTIEHPHEVIFSMASPVTVEQMDKVRSYLQFGWAPLLFAYTKPSDTSNITKSYVWSDVYNYSSLVYNDLKVLNESCLISIFGAV